MTDQETLLRAAQIVMAAGNSGYSTMTAAAVPPAQTLAALVADIKGMLPQIVELLPLLDVIKKPTIAS